MQGSNFHPQTTYWFTSGIKSASTGFFPEGLLGTATASNQTEEEGITAINVMGSSDDPVVLIFATSIRQCLRAPPRIRCCHFTFSEDPPGLYILHKSCSWVFRYALLRALSSSQNHFPYTYVDGVDEQLMLVGNLATCPDRERYVCILMDEMHIKEDLVYDKHTGKYHKLGLLRVRKLFLLLSFTV